MVIDHSTVDNAIRGFVIAKRNEVSPRTVESYEDTLNRFLWHAQKEGLSTYLADLSPFHLRSFFHYLQTEEHRWESNAVSLSHHAAGQQELYSL